MKKNLSLLGLALLVMLVMAGCEVTTVPDATPVPSPVPKQVTSLPEQITPAADRFSAIDALQKLPKSSALTELEGIAAGSADSAFRERAVLALAAMAANQSGLSSSQIQDVESFLMGLASDKDATVRPAALASLALLQQSRPTMPAGGLSIRVEGEIRTGNTVTLVVFPSSPTSIAEARVGIGRITGDPAGIQVDLHRSVRLTLEPGATQVVQIQVKLEIPGEYILPVGVKLMISPTDQQDIWREVHLDVGQEGGSYAVVIPVDQTDELE